MTQNAAGPGILLYCHRLSVCLQLPGHLSAAKRTQIFRERKPHFLYYFKTKIIAIYIRILTLPRPAIRSKRNINRNFDPARKKAQKVVKLPVIYCLKATVAY